MKEPCAKVTCVQKKVDAKYLRLLRCACYQFHLAYLYKDEGVDFLKHVFKPLNIMG